MDDELARAHARWRALEEDGRDEEAADAAFADLYRDGVDQAPVALAFTARTLDAVAAAAERDRRRARRTRQVLVPIGAAAAAALLYVGGGLILSGLTTSLVWGLDALIGAIAGAAKHADAGAGLWSIMRSIGRAAAAFMSSPAVTIGIIALQGIAMAALVALQRLLGSDGEFSR
jgi:hypothetical protein